MAGDTKFEFAHLPSARTGKFDKDTEELFQKWGLKARMMFATFTYSQHFQAYQKQAFAKDFFQSPVVNATLQTTGSTGSASPLSLEIDGVGVDEVPCTILNMEFFDRLTAGDAVVRKSGRIRKCFDDEYDDFLISDELRRLLLLEESENYDWYSSAERREFLFRILKHLALGGPCNQYEDEIKPYLDTSKLLYKQLLCVAKDPSTQLISITSHVLKAHAKVKGQRVFPGSVDHEQTFCYLIIDNVKRHVTAWYHVWH